MHAAAYVNGLVLSKTISTKKKKLPTLLNIYY